MRTEHYFVTFTFPYGSIHNVVIVRMIPILYDSSVDDRDAREMLEHFGTCVDQFGVCFNRRPQREAARRYLDRLFNDSERKSMQALHARLSDAATYQALQHFVTHSP